MIKCENCGETWDTDTNGYEEAKIALIKYNSLACPACIDAQTVELRGENEYESTCTVDLCDL